MILWQYIGIGRVTNLLGVWQYIQKEDGHSQMPSTRKSKQHAPTHRPMIFAAGSSVNMDGESGKGGNCSMGLKWVINMAGIATCLQCFLLIRLAGPEICAAIECPCTDAEHT